MRKTATLILIVSIVLACRTSIAQVLVVQSNGSIQDAINAANPGDTVNVSEGTYYENLIVTKNLILQGQARDTTIIDGQGSGNVIEISADNVTVTGFTIKNGYQGIYSQRMQLNISDCNVTHHCKYCIFLQYSHYSQVTNCEVSDAYCSTQPYHGWGIVFDGCTNSLIKDVRVHNILGYRALQVYHGSGTVVQNVEAFNNSGAGFFMGYGSYKMIGLNSHDNDHGIYFNCAYNTSVQDCLLANNIVGLRLEYYSRNNIIEGNTFNSNSIGVFVNYPQVRNNHIFHNDFINNTAQATDVKQHHPDQPGAEAQYWHDGYPSGGNYWSDYNGVDLLSGPGQDQPGNDGIGDTPYQITPLAKDIYPLVRPFNTTIIQIDIKPGSDDNAINLGSQGLIPVAILSTDEFDALTVDPETITFGGAGLAVRGKGSKLMAHNEDVNADGLIDLLVQIETTNIDPQSLQSGYGILNASTYNNESVEGKDIITIVPLMQ